jgi:glycerol-3-phosphate acyltransferase PlsY
VDVLLAAVVGYLLGSIPVGLIVSRYATGVDVRNYGSGKTGFTNTLRVVGLKRALPVLAGDFLKGFAAAMLPLLWTDDPWARAAGGVAAIIGHAWPVFAGFRGGRAALAGIGALFALSPIAALVALPVMVLCVGTTRYVSLGSITAAFVAGFVSLALAVFDQQSWAYGAGAAVGAALIIALHHDNIRRLLAGTERKLGKGGERRVAPPTA